MLDNLASRCHFVTVAERAVPAVTETDATILARIQEIYRGASDISDEVARAVAEAIYAIDAPRMGNEPAPFATLGNWERVKFERMARAAVMAFVGSARG